MINSSLLLLWYTWHIFSVANLPLPDVNWDDFSVIRQQKVCQIYWRGTYTISVCWCLGRLCFQICRSIWKPYSLLMTGASLHNYIIFFLVLVLSVLLMMFSCSWPCFPCFILSWVPFIFWKILLFSQAAILLHIYWKSFYRNAFTVLDVGFLSYSQQPSNHKSFHLVILYTLSFPRPQWVSPSITYWNTSTKCLHLFRTYLFQSTWPYP